MYVQVWNIESSAEYNLNGPIGQVYAMEITDDMLFAGGQVIAMLYFDFLKILNQIWFC